MKYYLILIFLVFNFYSFGFDYEYIKIKNEKNINSLFEFYDKYRKNQLEKIFLELDTIFYKKNDFEINKILKIRQTNLEMSTKNN